MRNRSSQAESVFCQRRSRLLFQRLEDRTAPATLIWVGDVNGSWGANVSGNTNWFNQTTLTDNVLPHNGDNLQFTTMSMNHTQSNNISNLIPNSITISDTDYIIGGSPITVDTITDSSSAGANVLNLSITGPITVAVNASSTRLTLGGVISGSGALTKNGTGILRLSGASANTYTGLTTVNAGTLELNKSVAPAVPGSLTINGGIARELAAVQIATTTVTVGAAGTFDLNGFSDTVGPLIVDGGSVTIGAGTLTPGSVTMTGGSIASTGIGKLALQGNVTTNGASAPSTISGTLDLNGSTRLFTVADGPLSIDMQILAVISGSGGAGLTKAGTGALYLQGSTSNTFTGPTTVSAGFLYLSNSGNTLAVPGDLTINGGGVGQLGDNEIADTSTLTVNMPFTFDLNGHVDTINALVINGGHATIDAGVFTVGSVTMSGGSIDSTGVGKLVLHGDLTTIGVQAEATISGNIDLGGLTRTFTVAPAVPGPDLDISAAVSNGGLTKTGTGTLRFSGMSSNTYTSLTTVSAGTLELAKSSGVFTMAGNLTIDGGIVLQSANNQLGTATTVTVNASGTFNLNNFNDFLGPLTVLGGDVNIGTGRLDVHLVTMTGGSITSTGAGELDLSDNLITNVAPTPATISGRLYLGSVIRTFTIADGGANPDLNISAIISGSIAGLNKAGPGTLQFSGTQANTNTGTTTVSEGGLELAKSGDVVALPAAVIINGGVVFETANNQIADTSAVTVNSGGALNINNFSDTIGDLTVNDGSVTTFAGTLTVASLTMTGGGIGSTTGALVLQGDLTVNSAATMATINGNLDLGGTSQTFTVADNASVNPEIDISAVISNGGVFKRGTGTARFSGTQANTYTLTTTIAAGTLELSKTGGAPAVVGSISISTGTVRELGNNQVADTANVSVVSFDAHFDLNGFTDAVASLFVAGASVTIGAGILMPGTLSMDSGTISSTGAGKLALQSDLTTSAASQPATITGNLDLGGSTRVLNVGDGANSIDMQIAAVISNGGVTKLGPGTLRLIGSTSNIYTAPTTVAAGTLELNKSGGASAVPADLIVDGGVVRELATDQIADTSNLSVNTGGTFDLNGQTDSIGTMTITGGTLLFSGMAPGRLTTGNTSLNAASTLAMKLVDSNNSDHITVNGSVVVGGILQLSAPTAISIGTAIRLIDNDSIGATTGAFAGLPQGTAFRLAGQLFGISYAGNTGNDVVITRISGPAVVGTQINDGSVQRSRVTSLSISFSTEVTFAGTVGSAFTLTRIGGGGVAFTATAVNFNNVTTVTLNALTGIETEFGSLKDGRYTLTALASQISAGGQALDGNADGIGGDNYTFGDAQGLFRYFGDSNGDRHIDIADFGLFSSTFGLHTGQAGFLTSLDFNNDGVIDIADFGQFAIRMFTVLP